MAAELIQSAIVEAQKIILDTKPAMDGDGMTSPGNLENGKILDLSNVDEKNENPLR